MVRCGRREEEERGRTRQFSASGGNDGGRVERRVRRSGDTRLC